MLDWTVALLLMGIVAVVVRAKVTKRYPNRQRLQEDDHEVGNQVLEWRRQKREETCFRLGGKT